MQLYFVRFRADAGDFRKEMARRAFQSGESRRRGHSEREADRADWPSIVLKAGQCPDTRQHRYNFTRRRSAAPPHDSVIGILFDSGEA